MYKSLPHNRVRGCSWISNVEDVGLNPIQGRSVGDLGLYGWYVADKFGAWVNPPSLIISLSAWRSSGYLATGLQKFHDWPAQSSTVRVR
jgi:hypothetical protein